MAMSRLNPPPQRQRSLPNSSASARLARGMETSGSVGRLGNFLLRIPGALTSTLLVHVCRIGLWRVHAHRVSPVASMFPETCSGRRSSSAPCAQVRISPHLLCIDKGPCSSQPFSSWRSMSMWQDVSVCHLHFDSRRASIWSALFGAAYSATTSQTMVARCRQAQWAEYLRMQPARALRGRTCGEFGSDWKWVSVAVYAWWGQVATRSPRPLLRRGGGGGGGRWWRTEAAVLWWLGGGA